MEKEDLLMKNSIVRREFLIRYGGVEKRVTSLQMLNWPDHSSPEESNGYETIEFILTGINEVKLINPNSPILVHCSAGTGRTGTLIAIYNLTRCLNTIKYINQGLESKKKRIKPFISIFNIVRKLREQRMGMVSSYAQYKFIYDFFIEYLRRNMDCIEM